MKLYANIALIFENMTKNSKNEGKIEFFDQKSNQNDIKNFHRMICCIIKNHEKMILR